MSLDVFRFENLSRLTGVVHAITTRHGGVSEGRCESLNVSYLVGDPTENVDENLRRAADSVGARRDDLFSAYQVHGRAVTLVEPEAQPEPRPRCDALITRSPEKALMLRYADCTPVLLADTRRSVIGAVHAGWRGSAVRAAGAAVEALGQAFGSDPRDLLAGIGPAIGPCCYEVGEDVVTAFADRPWLFAGKRLDLWEANRQALIEAGVPSEHIEVAGVCTQCQSERFFSHRANGGQPAGRFAALIRLAC
ncbi:MAG: peptidoglycan editing factor PgeF [Chloroflexi bacterium]|nr:peptidoglycan editing factor PgeF [Chloroflexota bacterium]MBV9596510.1 peptidoglycan editing factor PgeF [Chloroflexota bacterium]